MPEWLLLLAGIAAVALYFLVAYVGLRVGVWLVMSSPAVRRVVHRGAGRALNTVTLIKERYEHRQKR
jgi:hypothetical protein